MKTKDETVTCEIAPCQVVAYGVPRLNPAVNQVGPKEVEISGFTTLDTSAADSQRRADGMLKAVFRQLKKGDHQALVNLLDEHPQFIAVPRIQFELAKWIRSGRSYRKPGRPRKGAFRHPLVVAGIVDELISRKFMKKGEAFEWVADHLCIDASTARDHYYNARSQARFKPLLMQTGPQTTIDVDESFRRVLETAELLECGKPVMRTLEETSDGEITVTFNTI